MVSFIYKDKSQTRTGGAVSAGIRFKDALLENNLDLNLLSYTLGNSNILGILKDSFLKNKVIWNLSTESVKKFLVIIFIQSFIKENVIIRFFGSNQKFLYENNFFYRLIFKSLFKLEIILTFETLDNYNFFKKINGNIYHLPNFIKITDDHKKNKKKYSRKFIFVGNILSEKGINLILRFLLEFPQFSCDFYGNNDRFILKEKYKKVWKKSYKGLVSIEEVSKIYKNYDFTLLPSFKEGYPSVVLESMNQGTPLVLSNLPSLMEMVEHSAIFFGTKYDEFKKVMLKIDDDILNKLTLNIKKDLYKYDQDRIIRNFIKDIL